MSHLRQFERLEKQFFNTLISREPILATAIGLHQYDDKLPNGSLNKELKDIRILKKFLREFSEINAKELSPSRTIDLELVIHMIRLWLYEKEEIRFWESHPEAPMIVGDSIFQIFVRNYAPLRERLRSIYKRLLKMPRYIEQSKTKLCAPVKLFVEIELETLTRLPGLFNTLKDIARENLLKTPFYYFNRVLEDVQNSLEKYGDWLIIDILPICKEEYAIGEEKFKTLLKLRGIDETPSQMLSFGESELGKLKAKLKPIAKQINRRASVDNVREIIKSQHPEKFENVLKYVRGAVEKARGFVIRSKFAEIPTNENLYVIETPSYLRHLIPFGAYFQPGKFEEKQDGYYFVTPGDSDAIRLKSHNFASLSNMTIHEGYPGHHLQLTCANLHKSLIRIFANATETIEGWAHYCEERTKEMGYDYNPRSNFMQISDLIWRAVRIIIDVKLSTGKMSYKEAVDYLFQETGMERNAAEIEVRRYILTPTYPLSYLFGKEKIKELKRYVKDKMRSKFNERFFHNTLLSAGSLPAKLLKKEFDWKIEKELKKKK